MFEDWEKDESGNFKVNPLTGWATLIAAETAVCVKLDYLLEGDRLEKSSDSVQLILTPPQAQEVARALLGAADKILKIQPTNKPS
jgi:hypothetical protein